MRIVRGTSGKEPLAIRPTAYFCSIAHRQIEAPMETARSRSTGSGLRQTSSSVGMLTATTRACERLGW